eukprot:CAMPEP_0202001590 /NCGR_PEP_ID=MMETSP0905-20130828/7656_1 /ASSEMBLY_ACC=CAM_ASM_000554 /TAXON_ID=420261 /ORGANISM="Thalassiosira antarctica, Strain CCMP982" /LENGTH=916 /DNA_ID=CAMNT_0048558319 /DNA_START=165 /DNA_END=2915 /DNA_ORIENTATION=-
MDDSADGNSNMDESPASPAEDESPSSPSLADASTADKLPSAPEPPRWRFVKDAKKSLGYSSLHAGSYIRGQSSGELGAKYVAPDVSLYKLKEETVEVQTLHYQLPTNKSLTKEDVEVGKLAGNVPPQNAFSTSNNEVGRLQIQQVKSSDTQSPSGTFAGLPKFESPTDEPRKPFKEWDVNLQVGPKKEREHEWWDGKINDSYTMPGDDPQSKTLEEIGRLKFHGPGESEEVFVGEIPKRNRDHDGDGGGDFEDNVDYGDDREETLSIHNDLSASSATDNDIENEKDSDASTAPTDPVDDENEKKKRRCLFLLLLLLLLLVIVVGVLMGQKDGVERAVVAGAVAGVLIPPIVVMNETTVPSFSASPSIAHSLQPSLSPSMECPVGTKAFSIEHLNRSEPYLPTTTTGATWKVKDVCSGEVIAQCFPCSWGNLNLSRSQSPLTQPGSNGPPEEKGYENITECLSINNEYALVVIPAEDTDACCGFDHTTSIISYDDVVVKDVVSSDDIFDDESNMYFGVRETPCASESPSASPTVTGSAKPSLLPSQNPSDVPSTSPSSSPSLSPSTSPPTQSPVVFIGGCPESYVPFLNAYVTGTEVESNGIIYKCIRSSCGAYGFAPGESTSSLWRQGWEVVGSCSGTMAPTLYPTVSPTTSPTNSPSGTPSRSPSKRPTTSPSPAPTTRRRTRHPTKLPSTKPTCSTEQEFNLCVAIDMSGSVCNDGMGSECLECRSAFLPMFFTSECRDRFVSEDTCCNNFANVKEFSSLMVNLLGDFPAEKSFSVVQFATNARLVSGLSSTAQTLPVIGKLDYTGGLTNHASAIQMCQQTLSTFGSRKNFIMLITDGVSSEPEFDPEGAAEAAAVSAKNDGTFIIPVFISSSNDWSALAFMRRLSSDGEVFDVTDFDSLNSLQDRLVDQVSCS